MSDTAPTNQVINGLTSKQRAFVLEYAQHRNGVAATRAAGYKGDKNALAVRASELVRNRKVAAAIEELTRPALEEAQVSVKRIVDELSAIAFAPPEAFARVQKDRDGNAIGACLNMSNKLIALRLLGQYFGMFSQPADTGEQPPSLNFHMEMSGEESRQKLLEFLRQRNR